jgi:hypothetical protein
VCSSDLYGKVSPQFWIGKTGKALRGNQEAQILALYLMTSPHANMIGVFHCPIAYMAHETGLSIEGTQKGLQCLIDADFCTFDADDEYVFVHQFALHQVGEQLQPSDKRCKGVENELAKVPKNQCWQAFRARYAEPYNLPILSPKQSPIEAPSKPPASQKQEQEQEQKQEQNLEANASVGKPTANTPFAEIVAAYHEKLPELPAVRLETEKRKREARSFWGWVMTSKRGDGTRRAETREQGLAFVSAYFERASENDFLMGRTPRSPAHQNWKPDFEFLISEKGRIQVVEKTQ